MFLNQEAVFSIILSLKVLAADLLLLIIAGNIISFYLAESNSIYAKIISFILDLPLALPPIVTGFLLLYFLSQNSSLGQILSKMHINLIFNFYSLVLAGFIASLPWYSKPLISAIKNYPVNVKEAAYISGKSKLNTFMFVILPGIKKTFLVSIILSITRIFSEIGISLMLGGNIPFKTNTISLEIFTSVFNGDLNTAFNLSIIMFIISLIFFIILKILEKER
ncbi:molybdate transport system permease protein [Lebetimonas natsushimae]|uniref:Molybdate transport system permease protein n=1 Tax=Lebetimonas natsushimae TaxID=1936991 RepID=A0A292YC32_9BACT|nr:ABC transporter permease subunit [Lebetimonas natsushimae]GAX87627.1 molybdate transport system permease protein [Lebetimonas natsushimae]